MALILNGLTKCKICAKVIGGDEDVVGFPAYHITDVDPGYRFNDAAVHTHCLKEAPLELVQEFKRSELIDFLGAHYPEICEFWTAKTIQES